MARRLGGYSIQAHQKKQPRKDFVEILHGTTQYVAYKFTKKQLRKDFVEILHGATQYVAYPALSPG